MTQATRKTRQEKERIANQRINLEMYTFTPALQLAQYGLIAGVGVGTILFANWLISTDGTAVSGRLIMGNLLRYESISLVFAGVGGGSVLLRRLGLFVKDILQDRVLDTTDESVSYGVDDTPVFSRGMTVNQGDKKTAVELASGDVREEHVISLAVALLVDRIPLSRRKIVEHTSGAHFRGGAKISEDRFRQIMKEMAVAKLVKLHAQRTELLAVGYDFLSDKIPEHDILLVRPSGIGEES